MDAKGIIATILGIIALFAFGTLTYYLATHVGQTQQEWDRLVYLFGGVEAVAFAAAGYFFGKEVNRERAEKAEDKAEEKDAEAKSEHGAKERAATNLSSLIKYIETQEPPTAARSSDVDDILSILRKSDVAEKVPDLTATIAARFDATSSARDEHWGNLLKFARSLQ